MIVNALKLAAVLFRSDFAVCWREVWVSFISSFKGRLSVKHFCHCCRTSFYLFFLDKNNNDNGWLQKKHKSICRTRTPCASISHSHIHMHIHTWTQSGFTRMLHLDLDLWAGLSKQDNSWTWLWTQIEWGGGDSPGWQAVNSILTEG